MIYFFADDHFNRNCGRKIFNAMPEDLKKRTVFTENRIDMLNDGAWEKDCELLILHLIGGTCGNPPASETAEKALHRYLDRGGNMLLLHGSSAAFWHWDWWRKICGLRWVRPGDPDGVEKSVHPVQPFKVNVAKCRHELCRKLLPMDLPCDEIYIHLEQTNPVTVFMETIVNGETFPQCFETVNERGGKYLTFLPGHNPEAFEVPEVHKNIAELIRYLIVR